MKKGLIIFHNNMEDAESIATNALLRRAGFKMTSVAKVNKAVKLAYDHTVLADKTFEEIDPNDYDFLVIPGGYYVADVIEDANWIYDLIKKFNNKQKLIASICAAPMFLGKLNLLEGIEFTVFPSCEAGISGEYLPEEKVVTRRNIITGRSVGAIFEFVYEIILYLENKEKADNFYKAVYY